VNIATRSCAASTKNNHASRSIKPSLIFSKLSTRDLTSVLDYFNPNLSRRVGDSACCYRA
jgi:hypothetical protein